VKNTFADHSAALALQFNAVLGDYFGDWVGQLQRCGTDAATWQQ